MYIPGNVPYDQLTISYFLQFNDISLMSWNTFNQLNHLESDKVYFCDYLLLHTLT